MGTVWLIQSHFQDYGSFYAPLFSRDLNVLTEFPSAVEIAIPDDLKRKYGAKTFLFARDSVRFVDNEGLSQGLQVWDELPDVSRQFL